MTKTLVSLICENNALGASRWIERVLQEKTFEAIEKKKSLIIEAVYREAVAPEGQRPEKFQQTNQAKRSSLQKRIKASIKKGNTIRRQLGDGTGNPTSRLDLGIANMQGRRSRTELAAINTNHKNT
jgi:hypothetical protein